MRINQTPKAMKKAAEQLKKLAGPLTLNVEYKDGSTLLYGKICRAAHKRGEDGAGYNLLTSSRHLFRIPQDHGTDQRSAPVDGAIRPQGFDDSLRELRMEKELTAQDLAVIARMTNKELIVYSKGLLALNAATRRKPDGDQPENRDKT